MTHIKRTTTRTDFVIPAPAPAGATAADFTAAWTAADLAYREACNLPTEASLPDNALMIRPDRTAIVISFVVESGSA
jgi:hypothetical protein